MKKLSPLTGLSVKALNQATWPDVADLVERHNRFRRLGKHTWLANKVVRKAPKRRPA